MKRHNVIALTMFAAVSLIFPSLSMASAQASPQQNTRYYYRNTAGSDYNNNFNAVFLGGTTIMRFRTGAGGFTAHERAVATQERLNKLLGEGPMTRAPSRRKCRAEMR